MLRVLKSKRDSVDLEGEKEIKIANSFVQFLKFFGYVVPIGNRLNILKIVGVHISMYPITVGLATFLLHFLKHNSFQLQPLSDCVPGLASVLMAIFIQSTFLSYSDGIHRLLLDIGRLKKHEVPENWYEAQRQMNFYIKAFFAAMLSTAMVIMGILLLPNCEEGGENVCGLLISGRLPVINVYVTPNRQIFMVVQTVNAFQNGLLCCSIAGVLIAISRSLVLLMQKLRDMFLKIPKLPDRAARKEQIKRCVLYHYKILEMKERFAEYSTDTHFYMLFCASINISLNAYNVFLEIRVQMVLHLLIYIGFVLIICFSGEQLIGASDNFCDTIYHSIPLDGDNATANDLRFILLCSSRGIYIPAGKLGKVGLLRLQDLMSKSYSYFTMLINT